MVENGRGLFYEDCRTVGLLAFPTVCSFYRLSYVFFVCVCVDSEYCCLFQDFTGGTTTELCGPIDLDECACFWVLCILDVKEKWKQ